MNSKQLQIVSILASLDDSVTPVEFIPWLRHPHKLAVTGHSTLALDEDDATATQQVKAWLDELRAAGMVTRFGDGTYWPTQDAMDELREVDRQAREKRHKEFRERHTKPNRE